MLTSKQWAVTGITVSLALGIICGIIMDRDFICKRRKDAAKMILKEHLLRELSEKLSLQQTQVQAIGGILRVEAVKIKRMRQNFRSNMLNIKEETAQKIREHLTPDQKEQYDEFAKEHRGRWERICNGKKSCLY